MAVSGTATERPRRKEGGQSANPGSFLRSSKRRAQRQAETLAPERGKRPSTSHRNHDIQERILGLCFPQFAKRGEVLGVALATVEAVSGERDICLAIVDKIKETGLKFLKRRNSVGGGRKKTQVSRLVGQSLAALGHSIRLQILETLLVGPAVYRTLQKVTGLKAGPLYHHVNQLRLSSLILPKQRDLYELTRAGRNLILFALALEPFLKDRRRRPLAAAV